MAQQNLTEYRRSRSMQSFRYVAAVVLGLSATTVVGTVAGLGLTYLGNSDVDGIFADTNYDSRPFHRLANAFGVAAGVVVGGLVGYALGSAVWPSPRKRERHRLGRLES